MRVYFDTNVYSMIGERDAAMEVHRLLKSNHIALLVSEYNLIELSFIPNTAIRCRDERVVRCLATRFEKLPLPYRHATETLQELRRLRPDWVRAVSFQSKINVFLKRHKQEWLAFTQGATSNNEGLVAYRMAAEPANATTRSLQRLERETILQRDARLWLATGNAGESELRMEVDLKDAELAWRRDCWMAWFNAIVKKDEGSRDYRDYLGPYVKSTVFADSELTHSFWRDVDSTHMPLNRISGLAHHYQLFHKIGHGNSLDSLHACYLNDVDLFVTADKAFAEVLKKIAVVTPRAARVSLIDRASQRCATELAGALSGGI